MRRILARFFHGIFGAVLPVLLLGPGAHAGGQIPNRPELKAKTSLAHSDCRTCHKTHSPVRGRAALLRDTTESLCMKCHQGSPAAPDGAPRFAPWLGSGSRHLKNQPRSRAMEYKRVVRDGARQITLRQDCSACHDAHGKETGKLGANAFDARGRSIGRRPVSTAEICFGCHAGPEPAPTTNLEPDMGPLFSKGAASAHIIGATAADRNDLPSLRGSAFMGKLDCTSCHDNPDPAGPRGPHQSPFNALLRAGYGRERDAGSIGGRSNDLCYLCHDRRSIEANQSFPLHREHLNGFTGVQPRGGRDVFLNPVPPPARGLRDPRPGRGGRALDGFGEPTSCATCHDPHGSRKDPGLIRFDRSVVTPSSVGGVDFIKTGLRQGSCTLTCHGYDHVQTKY